MSTELQHSKRQATIHNSPHDYHHLKSPSRLISLSHFIVHVHSLILARLALS